MRIEYDVKLDFKDVLIRPKRSVLKSRSEVSLEREFRFKIADVTWQVFLLLLRIWITPVHLQWLKPYLNISY